MIPRTVGCQIGVVLYQQAFYISKANPDVSQELLGKSPYSNGAIQIGWEGDPTEACHQLVIQRLAQTTLKCQHVHLLLCDGSAF